ncbi:MAG: hypothetical protein HND52_02490 [Ignavibacteriae bacterium]|nr:hypothetical protein [Ignavibacteriota bacterium]NOG96818.1 hypothetical protein [Ignavibacteriota bacterium]
MKQIIFNLFCIVLALAIIPTLVNAQAPQLINYQGNLIENGTPVNGAVDITFSVFDVATAGTSLWTETQSGVNVANGVFQVLLGSATAFPPNLFTVDGERYLEVSVGGTALTPRYQFTSTAYALSAQMAEEVKPGEVVTSLNNLEDDITLAAGSNVNITEAGNIITISSTGGTGGGDITAVAAGDGLTGGGDTGDVTLDVGAGTGINVAANAVSLNTTFTDGRYINTNEPNSVSSAMIQDGQVGNDDIAEDAVSANKIIDEPGLAYGHTAGSSISLTDTEHTDLVTVTISIPQSGYILLTGRGMVELSGTTLVNGIRMQIDTTAAGGDQQGIYSYVLFNEYASESGHYFDCSAQRTYIVDGPAEYTFRLEARKFGTNGTARIYWPVLTAQYFPTAYGNVVVTSSNSPSSAGDPNAVKPTQ